MRRSAMRCNRFRAWQYSIMRTSIATLLLLGWSGPILAVAAEPAALPGRLPPGVVPVHYDISVELDAEALTLRGRAGIDIEVRQSTDTIVLNAADLTIAGARLDGIPAAAVAPDPEAETTALRSATPLANGRHRL